MRRVLVVLALGAVLCTTGCGGSKSASSATAAVARVVNGICQSDALRGEAAVQSCKFVLSDGEQFSCGKPFAGQTPTAAQLERAGCRRLPSLKLSAPERVLIARIETARTCLTGKRLRAVGGPVLPTPTTSTQARGELVLSSAHPTFIAFYADAAQAARVQPTLARADSSSHVQVERRGAETIAWSRAPTTELRNSVQTCLPG